MIKFSYALQTCDIASNQGEKRFASDSKTELAMICTTSFLESVTNAAQHEKESHHHVAIIDDHSTEELVKHIHFLIDKYSNDRVKVEYISLEQGGIMNSIGACWRWLQSQDAHFVFQVQDDYLFKPECIVDMADQFASINNETGSHSIIYPFNDQYIWLTGYRNKSTPRAVFCGKNGYWIQTYDIPCTFFTSKLEFSKHWDMYEKFLAMDPVKPPLEVESLNWILTRKGALGIIPIQSLAFHMQTELYVDPYVDWKPHWEYNKNMLEGGQAGNAAPC